MFAAKVNYERKWNYDVIFGILFILGVVVNIYLSTMAFANKNLEFVEKTVEYEYSNGTYTTFEMVPSETLLNERKECLDNKGMASRMLGENSNEAELNDMWDVMLEALYIPITCLGAVFILCVLWILALQKAAVFISWISVFCSASIPFAIGSMIWYTLGEHIDMKVVFTWYGIGAVMIATAFWKREAITEGGKHLKVAAFAVEENWSIFIVNTFLQLIFIGFSVFNIYAYRAMRHHYVLNEDCNFVQSDNSTIIRILGFLLVWIYFWTDGAKLVVTAMSVSSWYFNQDRTGHAFRGFKTIFSTSFGTIAFGAIISTITDQFTKLANRKCWYCDPIGIVLKFLWCFLKSVIETFGRFSLIAHSMTGDHFCLSGKNAFNVLRNNLGGSYVQDRVGVFIVKIASYAFSTLIGFAAWAWTDHVRGWETLGGFSDAMGGVALFWFFTVLFLVLNYRPIWSIIIVIFAANFVGKVLPILFSAPLIGMLCAAVSSIIFSFQGSVILSALNTIIFNYAVSKEANIPNVEGREEMYQVLLGVENDVKESNTDENQGDRKSELPRIV